MPGAFRHLRFVSRVDGRATPLRARTASPGAGTSCNSRALPAEAKGQGGEGATFKDAQTLARYAGLRPDQFREDNDFNRYVAEAMLVRQEPE
jgi:hypothetical protein